MMKKEKNISLDPKDEKFLGRKYMMHKYWGKKPAKELKELILKYSEEGDLLLDPFAGYGSFSCEAILSGRDVISNDLNPISNFINSCLLSVNINFELLDELLSKIDENTKELREYWYGFEKDGKKVEIITALRKKNGEVTKLRVCEVGKRKQIEVEISKVDSINFQKKEETFSIKEWYPKERLIQNSRISVNPGMTVADLFNIRSLSCHSKLLQIINSFPDCDEKRLLLLAFTSNLANCSKLVPPIKSRGEMSQGAWMTGFYVGETYLENNVFHYFKNRVTKIISGKKELIEQCLKLTSIGKCKITNEDAKNLSIPDETIDFIFTDFPYGDAVPYFEQSIIWNSWLNFNVDYENEIVISDSKFRNKNNLDFSKGIYQSICEIYRVLKPENHFIFTYHSLSGFEWFTITNSLFKTGFEIVSCELLAQKTFTPRQLNRVKTIKGDLLVICKKTDKSLRIRTFKDKESERSFLTDLFKEIIQSGFYETNEIITEFLTRYFRERALVTEMNMLALIEDVANFDGKGWKLNYEKL